MNSIFSRIVKGELPCYKIAENDNFLAFLEINPLVKGHTLVIPKQEIDYIFDMDANELSEFMQFAQTVAKQLKNNIECKKVAVVVLGLEVPHAHIHLIPVNELEDINFNREKLKLTTEQFKETQCLISF